MVQGTLSSVTYGIRECPLCRDRQVGNHLGIRMPGDKDSGLDSDHFEDWGKFRFTAYKLTRVAKWMNWIGD
jgi:hypothetical protein